MDEMTSIKSLARTLVIVAVLFGQITFITPIPMSGPPTPPSPAGASGALDSFLNDQQQQYQAQQQQQQASVQNLNLLHSFKDRFAQQEDPRLIYLRELIERLQVLEYQERVLLQNPPTASFGYDYENDVPDFNGYNNNPAKRSWDKMNGVWGKRAAGGENWNKFRGKLRQGETLPRHLSNWPAQHFSFARRIVGQTGAELE